MMSASAGSMLGEFILRMRVRVFRSLAAVSQHHKSDARSSDAVPAAASAAATFLRRPTVST